MSTVHTNAVIFSSYLPDPDATLFQPTGGITRLICFPQLPPEIRLYLWRLTFPPPRYVELSGAYFKAVNELKPPSFSRREKRTLNLLKENFPPSLSINQESRTETLYHYQIVFPPRKPVSWGGDQNQVAPVALFLYLFGSIRKWI